jgi:hypothetical protein
VFAPQGKAGEWMKADISDAPERVIGRRHKSSVFYIVLSLAIGSIATIAALQFISRAPSIDSAYKRSVSSAEGEETLVRASEIPPRQDLDSSRPQASSNIPLPANTTRQTVFNDENFISRGADNVVTLHVGSDPSPLKEFSKKVKLTIVSQSPSMKERACWPYKQGSIESRNCRALIGLKHRD